MRKPLEFDKFPDNMRQPFGPFMAVCERIIDGDTYDCLADAGFNHYPYETIRLRGVNCPEIFHPKTAEERTAGMAARDFVFAIMPPGSPLIVTTYPDEMTFGRYVADIQLEDGSDLGERILAAGHGVPMKP